MPQTHRCASLIQSHPRKCISLTVILDTSIYFLVAKRCFYTRLFNTSVYIRIYFHLSTLGRTQSQNVQKCHMSQHWELQKQTQVLQKQGVFLKHLNGSRNQLHEKRTCQGKTYIKLCGKPDETNVNVSHMTRDWGLK